jgi:HicB family
MASLSLRLTKSLHLQAKEIASEEGVSINHLISMALAEKVSALKTEDYLISRAQQGSLLAFRKALKEVPDEKPLVGDEWKHRTLKQGR